MASATLTETLTTRLLQPFLPTGYPSSVTPDYTPYQVYDSVQAFLSTIASLLAGRAVLESHGLVHPSDSATSIATYATLISIVQESIGRFATILFADYAGTRIEAEVKFYRFFADIVNDFAFILDVASGSLPGNLRVVALCVSSCCRAICGVAGGSSKAILSAHFAKNSNIGELNAKDGSQETVVSLLGMWAGGLVVARVEGVVWTWVWMLLLLLGHLWANYMAVRSVKLNVLNKTRASLVFSELLEKGRVLSIQEAGDRESVMERVGLLKNAQGQVIGSCRFGTNVTDFVQGIGGRGTTSGSLKLQNHVLPRLLTIFKEQHYILWFESRDRLAVILLKDTSKSTDQIMAWCHTQRVALAFHQHSPMEHTHEGVLSVLQHTLKANELESAEHFAEMRRQGWNVAISSVEASPGVRVCCADG